MSAYLSKRWGWLLGIGLLLAALAGCDLISNLGKQPQAPTPVPPTAAPFTPTFIALPPTYTPAAAAPVPSPTPVPTQTPTPTLPPTQPPSPTAGQPSPTVALATPTPTTLAGGGNGPVFAGLCFATSTQQPCLYSVGIMNYHGERVCRYVFENIPYPQTAFVEINGVSMECIHLPEYPQRIYCMGVAPPTSPIQLRLGWYENGQRVDVYVDQAVVDDIQRQHLFPIGAPPTPTLRPSPTAQRYP